MHNLLIVKIKVKEWSGWFVSTWIPGVNSHYRVMGPFRLVSFELRLRLVLSNYRLQAGNDKREEARGWQSGKRVKWKMQVWENEAAGILPLRLPFWKGRGQQRRSLDVQTGAERGMTGLLFEYETLPCPPWVFREGDIEKPEFSGREIWGLRL